MAGSSLNSGSAAQLVAVPGVVGCDLDGAALVTDESEWSGGVQLCSWGLHRAYL